jgi:solute carrier family 25 oxoglutarate transporter 11
LYAKHILGPFTSFYSYDWLKDKLSVLWRISNTPSQPVQVFCAAVATYLGAVFTYPFAHVAREMVDFWPKKNGIDPFDNNYRKAAVWLWFGPTWNLGFPGLFKIYFWNVAPLYFIILL